MIGGVLNLSLENISHDDIHLKPSQCPCQTQAQTMNQLTGENDQVKFYNLMTTVCNNITFNLQLYAITEVF